MRLVEFRRQLVEGFEPGFRMVGNTTQDEIVKAIDLHLAGFQEALDYLHRATSPLLDLDSKDKRDMRYRWIELSRMLDGVPRAAFPEVSS